MKQKSFPMAITTNVFNNSFFFGLALKNYYKLLGKEFLCE